MEEHAVVLAVGSYRSRASADDDCRGLCRTSLEHGPSVTVAVLEKGADGQLTLIRDDRATRQVWFDDPLLGSALVVLAPPVGIVFLASRLTVPASWAGVGSIVAHLWHGLPKEQLVQMTELLETGQSALVVTATDVTRAHVAEALARSTSSLVSDPILADVSADCLLAIDEARGMVAPGLRHAPSR